MQLEGSRLDEVNFDEQEVWTLEHHILVSGGSKDGAK